MKGSSNSKRAFVLLVLVVAAAAMRLLLQASLMPPYAGLDEIYHVARIVFRSQEGRNPTMNEPSIPIYLERSIRQESGATPAFAVIAGRWTTVVEAGARPVPDPVDPSAVRQYRMANYEAQHPSLYYSLMAWIAPAGNEPMRELRLWRLLSLFFALLIVVATALIGYRFAGPVGIIAASVVVSLPTWQTLVVRASNDALACAAIAVALAFTLAAPSRAAGWLGEAAAWAVAAGAKLYSWPIGLLLPFAWWRQRASWKRIAVVTLGAAIGGFGAMADLNFRTRNPIGLFAFDPLGEAVQATPVPIDWFEALKITIATAAWTSGQHWNALTPLGIILYLGPTVLLVGIGVAFALRRRRDLREPMLLVALALGGFAIAQAIKLYGYLRSATLAGETLPAGGKEAWYWYSMVPLLVGVCLAAVFWLKRHRPVTIAVMVGWFIAWDLMMHEGALFRDWSGATSAETGGVLFRWSSTGFEGAAVEMAVGPFASIAFWLRLAHLILIAAALLYYVGDARMGVGAPAATRNEARIARDGT